MIQEKIPANKRNQILLVASGQEILWVIGYRINEAYKVLEGTKRVLKLEWQPQMQKEPDFS